MTSATSKEATKATIDESHEKELQSVIDKYIGYIVERTNHGQESFLHCGTHYRDLSRFLTISRPPLGSAYDKFSHVVVRNFGEATKSSVRLEHDAHNGYKSFAELPKLDNQSASIIFVRGLPSKEWVGVLGSRYRLDIDFFRQHLNFLEQRDFYEMATLPSNSRNILRLRIPSILVRRVPTSQAEFGELRVNESEKVLKMQRSVRDVGESIVRRFSFHNETYVTIEQDLLVTIVQKRDRGWTAVVLSDFGKDLHQSLACLGREHLHRYDWIPVIRHLPAKMLQSLKSTTPMPMQSWDSYQPPSWSHLPTQYGLYLDQATAVSDWLYGLSEIFTFFTCSEGQFLGFMEKQVFSVMQTMHKKEEWALESLNRARGLLNAHIEQIEEIRIFVDSKNPRSIEYPPHVQEEEVDKHRFDARECIQKDFVHLARRARNLHAEIVEGRNSLSERMILAESRRAIDRADSMHRLTLLAFFFLPLSFFTSLFGTNFRELGSGDLSMWILAPLLLFAFALSAVMCFWTSIRSFCSRISF